MFEAGSGTGGISFVTRREAAAYERSCCGACSFDQRMRRQLELHALYEEAPSKARVLVVRRDGAMTVGMGNRMNSDARALLIAMHLDRALLFAECAYDGVASRLGLPSCSTPHLDYSSVMSLPHEVATVTFGRQEARALAAAGHAEHHIFPAGAPPEEACEGYGIRAGRAYSSKRASEARLAQARCEARLFATLGARTANHSWLTMQHDGHLMTALSSQLLRHEGRGAACLEACARFVTLQPRGAALALLRASPGLTARLDAAARIGAIHIRTGAADGARASECASIGAAEGLRGVDACFASRRDRRAASYSRRCRTRYLFDAFGLSTLATALSRECDAVLYVSDHAEISALLNGAHATPARKSLAALLPAALKGNDSVTGHSSLRTSRAAFARLTLRAAVEFYLLSMAHVLVQTLPSVFSWLAHQRGALCGQTAFVELFAHDGAAQLCRTLARSAPGTPLESACAECSRMRAKPGD